MTIDFLSPSCRPKKPSQSTVKTAQKPRNHSASPTEGVADRWKPQSMRNVSANVFSGSPKWSSSHNLHPNEDEDISMLLDDDKSLASQARKNWKEMDERLTIGGQNGRRQPSPRTPTAAIRKKMLSLSSPGSHARNSHTSSSPESGSNMSRWGESPHRTLAKHHSTSGAPPILQLSPMAKPQRHGSGDSRKWARPSIGDTTHEWNVSMSSMAPQLPQRFSSDTSVTSVESNTVLRGHKVYKIQPASSFSQPSFASPPPTPKSRSWTQRSPRREHSPSSTHPEMIPEGEDNDSTDDVEKMKTRRRSPKHDRVKDEILAASASTNSAPDASKEAPQMIIADDQKKDENPEHSKTVYELLVDQDLQRVDTTRVREMVVDKVPSPKRWSSRYTEQFPIWPPVIKVVSFEKRRMSGVSLGSDFSDDLTASEGDFLSSLGDNSLSTEDEVALLLPEQQTSYRIRYDGPTELENLNKIYELPPVPSRDDRFDPSSPSPECPKRPSRSSRRPDSLPQAPRRGSSLENLDNMSLGEDKGLRNRPDVWITPSEGDAVSNAVWKVKRVWAVDEEDEKEEIHSVQNTDLFKKIKKLVGAPDSPSYSSSPVGGSKDMFQGDEIPRRPSRSWHVLSVVERNGRMEDLEPEKEFADDEMEENIDLMAQGAVGEIELNKKAIEEAKKRIRLLKDANLKDQRKTLRRQPMSRRNLLDSNGQGKENMTTARLGDDVIINTSKTGLTENDANKSNSDAMEATVSDASPPIQKTGSTADTAEIYTGDVANRKEDHGCPHTVAQGDECHRSPTSVSDEFVDLTKPVASGDKLELSKSVAVENCVPKEEILDSMKPNDTENRKKEQEIVESSVSVPAETDFEPDSNDVSSDQISSPHIATKAQVFDPGTPDTRSKNRKKQSKCKTKLKSNVSLSPKKSPRKALRKMHPISSEEETDPPVAPPETPPSPRKSPKKTRKKTATADDPGAEKISGAEESPPVPLPDPISPKGKSPKKTKKKLMPQNTAYSSKVLDEEVSPPLPPTRKKTAAADDHQGSPGKSARSRKTKKAAKKEVESNLSTEVPHGMPLCCEQHSSSSDDANDVSDVSPRSSSTRKKNTSPSKLERKKIEVSSMVHDSDSEDELLDDRKSDPESKTPTAPENVSRRHLVGWWQKTEDGYPLAPVMSSRKEFRKA